MCGIALHFNSLGQAAPLDLRLIHHRGPDSSGAWTSEDGCVWLGNTRLAIVDPSPAGAQPMTDPATGNVIVANGEIYNHLALRAQLGPDVLWRGTSDTETLLQAYAHWGPAMLERVKGMFAFAVYDPKRREIFVARDRLGIKPLYYIENADGVRLASEVRLFNESRENVLSPEAIAGYLQWGTSPERRILFDEIRVLPAGHSMTIGASGALAMQRYWPARKSFHSPPGDVVARVRRLLETAVEEHLLADVPVASFLSGGIDSSVITALAARARTEKLQTFSVGFATAEFDESAIALEVAQRYGTDHHRIELSAEEVIQSVKEAVEKMDLPSTDGINTYIVSRAVAARGIKVALSGLGGDELFGGYPSFRDVPRLQMLARLPRALRRGLGAVQKIGDRLAELPGTTDAGELARWRRRFMTDEMLGRAGVPSIPLPFECPAELRDDFARISWAELAGYMRRMLLRDADQMSMAVSLELRVPFLDHALVEYVLGLPAAEKKRPGNAKMLLVEACRDLLPVSVYDRPKRGFTLPMKEWMTGPLESFVADGLRAAIERELLPAPFVDEMVLAFRSGRLQWTRLWSIVVLGHYAERRQLHRAHVPHENPALHSHG